MMQLRHVAVEKSFLVSQRITRFFYVCFITAGLMAILGLNQTLLKVIRIGLSWTSLVLIAVSWILPGIFILLRRPWLARAWLRGIMPSISSTPWEELSRGAVFFTYFHSILISGFMLLAIISFIINGKLAK